MTGSDVVFDGGANKAENSLYAKVGWRILPLVILGFLVNYLDRTNVSFASLSMNKDIGLTASQFGTGAGILFFGYCLFEVPSNIALYRFGVRIWLARIMIVWGIVSAAMILVEGTKSLYLIRFLLGAAEAGYFPGVAFYFTLWFPREYRARMYAGFVVAIPIAGALGAPISTALLELDGVLGLAGWKWMFLLEALPAVLLGIIMYAVLADNPRKAKWLTDQEKDSIERRLAAEPKNQERHTLLETFRDPRVLVLAATQFCYTTGTYGFQLFYPLILKSHGISNAGVGWLYGLSYLAACLGMLTWAHITDRSGKPIFQLAMTCLVSGLGIVGAVFTDSFILAYIGLTMTAVATISSIAVLWTIPTRFLSGIGAAGGLAMINSIGVFGGFVGPYVVGFLKDATGSFNGGLVAMSGFFFVAVALAFVARQLIKE